MNSRVEEFLKSNELKEEILYGDYNDSMYHDDYHDYHDSTYHDGYTDDRYDDRYTDER